MKTIAIWYEEKKTKTTDPSPKQELDINVNFWKLKLKNKPKKKDRLSDYDFMDFGFMVYDITNIKNLNIHFPFNVEKEDICDLGTTLAKSKEGVNSVFNENYTLIDCPDHAKEKSVQDQNSKTLFNIYALDFNTDDVSIKPHIYEGTQLSLNLLNITANDTCKKYYFRIRINGECLTNFIKKFKPEHWYFQSAFTSIDTVDFRINEKRNLNPSLVERISNNKTFQINKIHFFLMRDGLDDIVADHLKITCRELEPKLWKNYVGDEYNLENVIAYHWSEKATDGKSIDSFNTLVKIKYNKSDWATIVRYLLIAAGISIVYNLLYDAIKYILF